MNLHLRSLNLEDAVREIDKFMLMNVVCYFILQDVCQDGMNVLTRTYVCCPIMCVITIEIVLTEVMKLDVVGEPFQTILNHAGHL